MIVRPSAESVNIGCTVMSNQNNPKRKYELKQRAEEMAETRKRITEAAVELHGTIGPARTTLSAVAKRAGVQRHTVYRHFPTDADLFGACSTHYLKANPWPDIEPWRAIGDPRQRLAQALDELYAYYERTEPMLSNVLRDLELVDDLRPTIVPFRSYLAEAVKILATGWSARGRRRLVLDAALHHAVDFQTWRSLTANDRITRVEAAELAVALVASAAARRPGVAA
jgi:AcrR family transcriptional regulator